MTETEAKRVAYRELNRRFRILAPASEAIVSFPEYDPCRAANIIARIDWPATVNCRETMCTYFVCDGDPV